MTGPHSGFEHPFHHCKMHCSGVNTHYLTIGARTMAVGAIALLVVVFVGLSYAFWRIAHR